MRMLIAFGAVLLIGPAAWADGDWVDYQMAGPFECRSEFRLDRSGSLLRELEQLQFDIQQTLGLEPSGETIELNLFKHKRSYARYLASRFPEGASRQALYIKGPDMGRMYVYRHFGYETDVRHEGTHAILHSILPFVPMWLDEGLAEYFEEPPGQRARGHFHLTKLRILSRFGWNPRLEVLESKTDLADMGGKDYRDSWAWVHFMLHGPPEARAILVAYLKAIERGDPPGPLSTHLKHYIPDVERQIVEHFRTWK